MPELFMPGNYRSLLDSFLARGYRIRRFQDAEPSQKHLILRHDLDVSLQDALPIAEIEHTLGARATYFVLLRSEMYNPLSPASQMLLERLLDLGHDIGLHFDAVRLGTDFSVLDAAVEEECETLERLLGREVTMVSFHRPVPALVGYPHRLAGRRHAYEPQFFSEMGYCSDSRGEWGHGHPLQHSAVRSGRALQLLTHPVWWTAKAHDTVQTRLDRFARDRYHLLRSVISANCTTYDSNVPPE